MKDNTSTIDFYMVMAKRAGCQKFEFVNRISKYLKALFMFILSFFTFSYLIFCFEINEYVVEVKNMYTITENDTITERIYAIVDTEFKATSAKTVI